MPRLPYRFISATSMAIGVLSLCVCPAQAAERHDDSQLPTVEIHMEALHALNPYMPEASTTQETPRKRAVATAHARKKTTTGQSPNTQTSAAKSAAPVQAGAPVALTSAPEGNVEIYNGTTKKADSAAHTMKSSKAYVLDLESERESAVPEKKSPKKHAKKSGTKKKELASKSKHKTTKLAKAKTSAEPAHKKVAAATAPAAPVTPVVAMPIAPEPAVQPPAVAAAAAPVTPRAAPAPQTAAAPAPAAPVPAIAEAAPPAKPAAPKLLAHIADTAPPPAKPNPAHRIELFNNEQAPAPAVPAAQTSAAETPPAVPPVTVPAPVAAAAPPTLAPPPALPALPAAAAAPSVPVIAPPPPAPGAGASAADSEQVPKPVVLSRADADAALSPSAAPPETGSNTLHYKVPTQLASLQPMPSGPSSSPVSTVIFAQGDTAVPTDTKAQLTALAERLRRDDNLRISVVAHASGTGDQTSTARRVSLARALAVRAYLIDQGVDNLRINVQAEGSRNAGDKPDRVDLFLLTPYKG